MRAWFLALLAVAGCGDKSDTNLIHVIVDATSMTPTERAVIRSMSVRVTGDVTPVQHTYPIADQLLDGETSFPYYPGIDHGVVSFRIGVNDVDGMELSWSERAAEVGGEVRLELRLGAQYDGGVDAAQDDAGDQCSGASCGADDGCCPGGCGPGMDRDCAGCGNGRLESGETCDPPASCLSCDDMDDCTSDSMAGSAAMCTLMCSHTPKTCSNAGKDRCCPAGCTTTTDSDCAGCGDGVVDPSSGETCDPPASCPTGATCVGDANNIRTFVGMAATCNARCNTVARPCSNVMDGFCPTACTAVTDVDCPGCGNGRTEAGLGETCDPPASCPMPAQCVSDANNIRTYSGSAAACTARCTSATRPCSRTTDGFCPTNCTAVTDVDCPGCGNGRVEAGLGETCDGNCPTCPRGACFGTASGSAATCNVDCAPKTMCAGTAVAADRCCPLVGAIGGKCTRAEDLDCRGTAWQKVFFQTRVRGAARACTIVRINGIEAGGSYMFTSCIDPADTGVPGGVGNPFINRILDTRGNVLSIPELAEGGDCTFPQAIPNALRWDCRTSTGASDAFCSGNDTGGIVLPAVLPSPSIDIEFCDQGSTGFDFTLYILYNHATGGAPSMP